MRERLLRILLVAGCLYATACTLNRETLVPDVDVEGEEIAVTFLLSAEDQMVSARAGEPEEPETSEEAEKKRTLSDGRWIDKVVYAVYVKVYDNTNLDDDGNPTWTGKFRLLDQYGDGTEGDGQAKLALTGNLRTENGESLTLRLMRGQEYVIGFWAQSTKCKAYNSENLEAVVMDYKEDGKLAPNNDEIRDAFCQVYTFTAQIGVTEKVVLTRALAQINVGTAGWDYNNEVDYGNSFAYSKIEMSGLHNTLNVLTGEVFDSQGFNGEVTYDWAPLPAYINSSEGGYRATYTKPAAPALGDTKEKKETFATWLKNPEEDKEFLYVKLLANTQDYLPYITEVPGEEQTGITTEVFKYLSMCYVLAPTATYTEGTQGSDGVAIDALTLSLAEFIDENGVGYVYRDPEKENKELAPKRFTLPNVPVQRNWRTNILGGTRGATDSSLFDPRAISLWIDLDPGYDGDHIHYDQGDGKDDGWKQWQPEEEQGNE